MDKVEFGQYVSDIRSMLGWSAEKLAKELKCNRQTLRKWEQGLTMPVSMLEQVKQRLEEILSDNDREELDTEHKEFGEFLHNMRTSVGWTSEQMGSKLGYHRTTIARWEKGKSLSKIDDLHLLEQQIRQVIKEELQQRRLAYVNN